MLLITYIQLSLFGKTSWERFLQMTGWTLEPFYPPSRTPKFQCLLREDEALFVALSPHELYERKVTMQELHAAIASLPNKQAKRIYAHFILGMTKQDIARAEGVHEKVVRVAIERGLRRLEKILKNSL